MIIKKSRIQKNSEQSAVGVILIGRSIYYPLLLHFLVATMISSSQALIIYLFAFPTLPRAFQAVSHHRKLTGLAGKPIGDDDEDEAIYNDFGDMVIGDGSGGQGQELDSTLSLSNAPSLQNRFQQLVAGEKEDESRIEGNWQQGHWSVRGCSLDPGEGSEKTSISFLCSMDDTDILLVGRTDGSICWLQLGEEYLAKFVNQLIAKEGANNSIQVTEGLKREESSSQDSTESSESPIKFELLTQVKSNGGSILELAYADPFLFSTNKALELECWEISEEGPLSKLPELITQLPSSVVSLRTVAFQGQQLLLCVCRDGQAIAWQLGGQITRIPSHCFPMLKNGQDAVLSFDCDDRFCYVGTEQGAVSVYDIEKVLSDCSEPNPLRSFSPFADGSGGISAITSTGKGVMSTDRQETVGLVVGGTNGKIKQYELIPRGTEALEYWPKLDTQRIPGKSHIFNVNCEGPILAIKILPQVILAASSDELTLWNPASGKPLFGMQGLDFTNTKPSLLVQDSNSLLITNGMDQYVCLHDFSAEELDVDKMIETSNED